MSGSHRYRHQGSVMIDVWGGREAGQGVSQNDGFALTWLARLGVFGNSGSSGFKTHKNREDNRVLKGTRQTSIHV